MYEYKAKLKRVVDADTIDVDVDVGFKVHMRQRLRLLDVDAPERYTFDGKRLTQYVKDLFEELGSDVIIKTRKCDAFGRYLAEVRWYGEPDTLNLLLLKDPSCRVWGTR